MFFLIWDLRFITLHLISSFIGHEQIKVIVEKYDKKSLFSMFLKCYYHLHPLVEYENGVIDEKVGEDRSLGIFEMTIITNEPIIKLINRELLIFKCYQVDVKNIKWPLSGGKIMRAYFLQLVFVLEKFKNRWISN
jgi:hypothetical protein